MARIENSTSLRRTCLVSGVETYLGIPLICLLSFVSLVAVVTAVVSAVVVTFVGDSDDSFRFLSSGAIEFIS